MNKTKIEYVDYTWSPVTGCKNNCSYCYAKRIATRFRGTKAYPNGFKPTFRPERLNEPLKLKKPSKIFVCSMGDLFGDWVPNEWIDVVLDTVKKCPQHTFLFLTKNPKRYSDWFFPENAWIGQTIDMKTFSFINLNGVESGGSFISFEPLLSGWVKNPSSDMLDAWSVSGVVDWVMPQWVILGSQTNPYKPPRKRWVEDILDACERQNIPVFLKDNLQWPEKIQEFPREKGEDERGLSHSIKILSHSTGGQEQRL